MCDRAKRPNAPVPASQAHRGRHERRVGARQHPVWQRVKVGRQQRVRRQRRAQRVQQRQRARRQEQHLAADAARAWAP